MPRNANQSKQSNYSLLDEFEWGQYIDTNWIIYQMEQNLNQLKYIWMVKNTDPNEVEYYWLQLHYTRRGVSFIQCKLRIWILGALGSNFGSGGVEWFIGTDTANR